ncbi:hypothetical protein BGX21_008757 [Mortierella sp. AD011]|nr:hypothetical protein BGX20_002559 [Mortierella sp. AD010]KAF9402773.1 hypothetical protein BGX21_008757 [Mortierella sp. AD011]
MAHLTPSALHYSSPVPVNIDDFTFGCSDFFKTRPPSKWLAEEYIKEDSNFDTFLTTLKHLSKKKSYTAVFCHKLLQHYQSSGGQAQLRLLKQLKSTTLSKETAKSSTRQSVYDEIHDDNNRGKTVLGSDAQAYANPDTQNKYLVSDPGHTTEESAHVGQKHPRDRFDDNNTVRTKPPRNRDLSVRDSSEGEDEDYGDDEDSVILVNHDILSTRHTSFHKVAAASTNSRTFIPSLNRASQSMSTSPSQLFPRNGASSTGSIKFSKADDASSLEHQGPTQFPQQADPITVSPTASSWNKPLLWADQRVVPSTTSTSTVRMGTPGISGQCVKNAQSANSMQPTQPIPVPYSANIRRTKCWLTYVFALFIGPFEQSESDTEVEDMEMALNAGQEQAQIEQENDEDLFNPLECSRETTGPFGREQQKGSTDGDVAEGLDAFNDSNIVFPGVNSAPSLSLIDAVRDEPSSSRDDEYPDPTINLAHFETLNQATSWICGGVDLITKFRDFRPGNMGPFSLVRDGIADMTHGSSFAMTLPSDILSEARKVAVIPDINVKWPTLQGISERVFRYNTFEDIAQAVKKEDMMDPIAAYMFSIVMAYSHYFDFHSEIPKDLNEREGFTDLTWSFIRGALTMNKIESRHLEVLVTGVQDRKNHNKNPFLDIMEVGQYCDGIAFHGKDQIFLAEASQIQNVKAEKGPQDRYKLARELRDSWLSQMKSICREAVPPRDFTVFGSCTNKDETKLLQLDFKGVFRLCQFDSFLIPLERRVWSTNEHGCSGLFKAIRPH